MNSKEELSVKIGIEIMEKYSTTIDYTPMFEDAAMRMAEELERWIPIEGESPKPCNDKSGFGDIRSEDEYRGTSIEGFPPEVVEWMLENQVKQGNKRNVEVFKEERAYSKIEDGFTWEDTEEKDEFCNEVICNKNFHLFFEKYPKRK